MSFPRLLRRLLLCVACGLLAAVPLLPAAERIPPVPKRHFTDETRTVSATTAAQLDRRLADYERQSGNQLLVVLYPKMESSSSVEDYTVRVAQNWGVGQRGKNNGAVLFVFKADRQLYLQVGYGLEGTLTDAAAHQIIEGILKPNFRAGAFDAGLRAAVERMISVANGEAPPPVQRSSQRLAKAAPTVSGVLISAPAVSGVLIFLLIVVSTLVRLLLRRGRVLGGRRFRRTLWGGGGGGGWGGFSSGGGSFGGGGGFSSGGGSFGGGGAGGRW